jgi:oxygen-independent coproporphyrinogen-3 oxidase
MNHLEENIILKYKKIKSGWYTHYPINGLWSDKINDEHFKNTFKSFLQKKEKHLDLLGTAEGNESQLYIHFPFCPKQCLFCHCFTIISSKKDLYRDLVNNLIKEITLKYEIGEGALLPIYDIHFGGGSPSVLETDDIKKILELLEKFSNKSNWSDVAIEIDSRNNIDENKLVSYSSLGINRISFGIQDFDESVGKSINRVHTYEEISSLLTKKVRKLFRSINFDLLYGLPNQTTDSLEKTLNIIEKLFPTRIAYYQFQCRPDLYKHQTAIDQDKIPSTEKLNEMNFLIDNKLKKFGYTKLGLDHYINKDDFYFNELINKKNIERNAIGYSPGTSKNIIGIGPSAMTSIDGNYFQNFYTIPNYKKYLEDSRSPITRGWISSNDDLIRREVIFQIINNGIVKKNIIEKTFNINFKDYFKKEIVELKKLEKDGLLTADDNMILETEIGKSLRIYIANCFDKYKNYRHSKEFSDGLKASDRMFQLRN